MAVNTFEDNSTSIDHETYSADANDTSVILVAGGADLDLSYVDVVKYGYASDLLSASFWGFNAAINVVRSHTTTHRTGTDQLILIITPFLSVACSANLKTPRQTHQQHPSTT